MNKQTIIGRLGQDCHQGKGKSPGSEFISFSVAATSGYGERQKTEWIDCLLFGRVAVGPYLKKGTQVYVEGDVTVEEYQGKPVRKLLVKALELVGDKHAQ